MSKRAASDIEAEGSQKRPRQMTQKNMLFDLHEAYKHQLNQEAQVRAEIGHLRGQLVKAGLSERQIDHFLQSAAKKKDRPASQQAAAKQEDQDATKPLPPGTRWADVLDSPGGSNKPAAVTIPTRPKPTEEKLRCKYHFLDGNCVRNDQCEYSHEWCDNFLRSRIYKDWVDQGRPLPTFTQRFVREAEQKEDETQRKAKLARDSKAAPESHVVIGSSGNAESDTSEQKDVPMIEP